MKLIKFTLSAQLLLSLFTLSIHAIEVNTKLDPKPEPAANKSVFLGHLLSSTANMPKQNTLTIGSHLLTYSPSDNLMIGTATFFDLFYNAPNVYFKVGDQFNKKQSWALQFDYLKTVSYDKDSEYFEYDMENLLLWAILSNKVTPFYTAHLNLSYMYYFSEFNPHSLRREPYNDDPYSLNISVLNDIKINDSFGLASEFGLIGLNYFSRNVHTAVSARYTTSNMVLNFGFSYTQNFKDIPNELREKYPSPMGEDLLLHPEISIQYFL